MEETFDEMLERFSEGHPKNPRGKYWESNPDRLYKAILKRQNRQLRNRQLTK